MDKIVIEKTDNFWIDNGIVALYKILRNIGYIADLDVSALTISSENNDGKNVEEIFNHAKEEVIKHYLNQTKNFGWILKGGQFEIYRKTDFKMHLKPFFEGKTGKPEEGAICTPNSKKSDLGAKGRYMTSNEYEIFLNFKEESTTKTIEDKKIKLANKGYLNAPPKYDIGKYFSIDYIKEGNKLCNFSGKFYKKVDKINGMNYPFLTSMTGEINFASQLQLKPNISSLYSFISLFSFYNLNFLVQLNEKGKIKDAHYFVLYDHNLKDLENFQNIIVKNINNLKSDFCSFETQITGTQYESECFFNFLLSVYAQVKQRIDRDKRKGILLKKSVFILSNDGNIFRNVKEYTALTALFELLDCFENYKDDELSYREPFLNFVRNFNKRLDSTKYDTTWRNQLCSNILSFRSILKTVELFMSEVKMKEEKDKNGKKINRSILFLDKIIEIYNSKTQKIMKTEMVEICKTLGNRIGAYCRENEDKGILFSIRNAKNRTEFLNVLAETQFRTEVSYGETFFKELPDNSQWEEYKALISIFAMNSFLFKNKKTTEK
jgi:hypothetical protein